MVMKLRTAINKAKKKLKAKAEKQGLWENFGQDEVRRLEDTYIDISSYTDEMNQKRNLIQSFNEWCMNYTGIMEISEQFVDSLEHQWSGEIELNNGIVISIWWTAWPMRRGKIKRVLNVYSDLPKVNLGVH